MVGNCAESVLQFILRHLTQETLTVGSVYCRVIIHCCCHCYRRMLSLREGEKVKFSVMSTCLFTGLWSQVNKSEKVHVVFAGGGHTSTGKRAVGLQMKGFLVLSF